ncbi:uncharacterized protein LOC118199846 [Stegodyphus dumicola]|uniref:uncharacterized protein LOC118199846 n=1 Tax=Stegodyphus dumicola TaxID=202533 RepID=UPI0015ABEA32|nr:uncharacterized protein LOC118199846 [Stegodyphus dumicola]
MRHFSENLIFWGVFCQVLLRASLEDQQDKTKKKADRFGWWGDSDPWLSEPQPPAPLGPPQRPQPPRPPAPLDQGRPPAPLVVQPPAPIQTHHHYQHPSINLIEQDHVTRGGVHAEDINCIRSNGVTLFSAVVVPPPEYTSQPVFEDAAGPNYSPADCAMRPNEAQGYPKTSFAMYVHHFNKCGVRVQQGSDGKEWISVTLRFPYMEGLRMAEDEYVMIMCKPQDRIATTQHVMDMRSTASEGRAVQTKKVFRNGPRDVACRMSLMTRAQGARAFNREMKSGGMVRVGQDMQIRGVVKEGDGWNYAMLKDVIITRVSGNKFGGNVRGYPSNGHDAPGNSLDAGENAIYRDHRPSHSDAVTAHDVAQLVFSDGCRNPLYRPVAPIHPQRDPQNPLVVTFNFKAFMFQNMLDGESLRLSVQVVACVELADCQQVFCPGDGQRGVGKKRKRREYQPVNSTHWDDPLVKNFTEDFQLTVTFGGFAKTPIVSSASDIEVTSSSMSGECKIILISVSSAAILFCLVTTSAAAIAIGSKRKGVLAPSADELAKIRKSLERSRRRK